MSLNLAEKIKERDTEKEKAETIFNQKVALQQFMVANGPIFREFARSDISFEDVVERDFLKEPVDKANKLAVLIASKFYKKPIEEISSAEARFFRADSADFVASMWSHKLSFDIEKVAEQIALAVDLADSKWDYDPFKRNNISESVSLYMTSASIAATIIGFVGVYDFRQGKENVVSRLLGEITLSAEKTTKEMLGENAPEKDINNLMQTVIRNLSQIMKSCYERKADYVVHFLKDKKEEEIIKWLNENDCLAEIINSFNKWTMCFGAYAIVVSRSFVKKETNELVNK